MLGQAAAESVAVQAARALCTMLYTPFASVAAAEAPQATVLSVKVHCWGPAQQSSLGNQPESCPELKGSS